MGALGEMLMEGTGITEISVQGPGAGKSTMLSTNLSLHWQSIRLQVSELFFRFLLLQFLLNFWRWMRFSFLLETKE